MTQYTVSPVVSDKEVTLSRLAVVALTNDRKTLVAPDKELAMAKLTLQATFEQLAAMRQQEADFTQRHPWLIGRGEPPPVIEGDDGGASLILKAYQLLCDRIEKRTSALSKSSKEIQEALVKHEDYKAKAGQMIPVSAAFAALIKTGGIAQKYIPDKDKANFLADFSEVQADFIKENPMLRMMGQE